MKKILLSAMFSVLCIRCFPLLKSRPICAYAANDFGVEADSTEIGHNQQETVPVTTLVSFT